MNNLIKIISIVLFIFFSSQTIAIDAKNSFAIKGAGVLTCQNFLQENKSNSKQFMLFVGWVDGYLTALNMKTKNTFDIAPWQSTELLVSSLVTYCKKHPDLKFFNAASMMVKILKKEQLTHHSSILEAKANGKSILLYKDILIRIQKKLIELKEYNGVADGFFNEQTKLALTSFQNKKKIKETGLPDQKTLLFLFQ